MGLSATPLPRVYVDPPTATISAIGNTVTIAVNVTGVSDLYGYDVYVGYNSTLLQKTAAAVTGTGQVVPTVPSQYSFMDTSVTGTVRVSVAFLEAMGAQSFNGSGTLLWITFNGTALGQSPINIIDTDTYLYDHFAGTIDIERPSVGGVITVLPKIGNFHTHHLNDPTDEFPNDYSPMVIPVDGKNVTIAPVITCTTLEDDVFKQNFHPCKLAQTNLTDNDWSDGDANYTYAFEDWTDYDWNDIVVSLYAVTNNLIINTKTCLESREAAWKNPFGVEITPIGMSVEVHWNSTDYPENHIITVNSGDTADIELFSESIPGKTAFLKIIPLIPPTASFVYSPLQPEEGEPVTFDASASTANVGTIISYSWNFGDGEFGTGKIVSHTYTTAGIYTVSLNVTNSVGKWDIESKRITVKPKPLPQPVGGHAVPINISIETSNSLVPRIGLALLGTIAVTIILIRRRKRH